MDVLLPYLLFSLGFNLILFLIAYTFQTDKITDISYSLSFLAIAIYSFTQSEFSFVDFIFLSLVVLWSIRLGAYLMYRIHKIGRDERFDEIRISFTSFLFFWVMQGLTCFIVMIPVILSNHTQGKTLSFVFVIGLLLAVLGWLIETIADYEKFTFKLRYPGKFMKSGLWSKLQHPNYAGELLFWWSIFMASLPYSNAFLGALSPLWITMIIVVFSGVRILQNAWKKKYGNDPAFQHYQNETQKLLPFIY